MIVEIFLLLVVIYLFIIAFSMPGRIGEIIEVTQKQRALAIFFNIIFAIIFFSIYYFGLFVCTYQIIFNLLMLGMSVVSIFQIVAHLICYKHTSISYTFYAACCGMFVDIVIAFALLICLVV